MQNSGRVSGFSSGCSEKSGKALQGRMISGYFSKSSLRLSCEEIGGVCIGGLRLQVMEVLTQTAGTSQEIHWPL